MKRGIFVTVIVLLSGLCVAQQANDASFPAEVTVNFTRVKPAFREANTAMITFRRDTVTRKMQLLSVVPSFWYRAGTTTRDYLVIHSGNTQQVFYNSQPSPPLNEAAFTPPHGIGQYLFSAEITSEQMQRILAEGVNRIAFIFMPNEAVGEHITTSPDKKLSELERQTIANAKKSFTITVSKPLKSDWQAFVDWARRVSEFESANVLPGPGE